MSVAPHSPSQSRGSAPHRTKSNTSFATLPSPLGSILNSPVDGEGGESPTESTHFDSQLSRSYGTLPLARRRFLSNKPSWATRGGSQNTFRRTTLNDVHESTTPHTLSSRLSQLSFRYNSRPKTMYDEPLLPADGGEITDSDAKTNGIRVWYTSYTSIDWLHDTIKDSLRFSRLRRRTSLRSRMRLIFDKSLGWFIVTIVGFLSAVVAFLVVRSEQWLFDLKEGYCTTSVWKAKSFCCPHLEPSDFANGITSRRFGELCPSWTPWHQFLFPDNTNNWDEAVEYISYTVIAVSWPFITQQLTSHLRRFYWLQSHAF